MIEMLRLLNRFIHSQRVLIYGFQLQNLSSDFQPQVSLSVCEPSLEEAKALHDDPEMDLDSYPWEILEHKLAGKTWHLLAAQAQGKFAGYIFYSKSEMSVVGSKKVDFVLPEYAGYPFKLFVHPSHRGLCIGKYLEQLVNTRLLTDQYTVAFRATNSTNAVQLHNYAKIGGMFVGSLSFYRSRIFNTVLISGGLKRAGLRTK